MQKSSGLSKSQLEVVAGMRAHRVNQLTAALRELLAADDAMTAFLFAADPQKVGEEEWDRQRNERSQRKRKATMAARVLLAEGSK